MPVQVGVGYVDIKPDMSGFSRQLRTGITRDISKAGADAGKSLKASLASSVKGALVGIGATIAAVKIGGFFSKAIDAASDLNEQVSKSHAVFKSSGGEIEQWARAAVDSIGLSTRAALEAAGGFGNMFVQMGLTTEQAAEMSRAIVELGVDFSSFHNLDITDILTAQAAAFRGEYDSLQRVLPLINAAAVEQRALSLTGKTATKELTVQDKALAVNRLMFEGAGDAAGDYERTEGSLANQMRQTTAAMENQSATLGETLIPLKKQWSKILREEIIPAFTDLFSLEGAATSWAAHVQNTVGDAMGFLVGVLQQFMRLMANAFEKLPTRFGEGIADDLRDAADAGDGFRDKMHASKEEMQRWAKEAGAADAAQAGLGDSTKKAAGAVGDSIGPTKTLIELERERAKVTRDAAAAERDLGDARKDLAQLLRDGPVDEEAIADARERLADATRGVASANRDLAKAQKEYDQAAAAANILGTDTALEAAADAADGLADAQDGVAAAAARERDAQRDLAEAQRGDPDFQDKLADARDRVADATDKVADSAVKVAEKAPAMTAAVNGTASAVKALNTELEILKPNMEWWARGGLLGLPPAGPLAPAAATPASVFDLPAFGAPAGPAPVLGPVAPPPPTTVQVDMTVLGPAPDPAILGKAIAWAL